MAGMDVQAAAAATKKAELVQFKLRMDGLKDRLSAKPGQEEELKQACRDFEAIFIGKLWNEMERSVPQEGYLHSKQEGMYKSMFNKEFSESMANAGGIGLADMLYDQLAQKLKQVSGDTLAANTDIKPLAENGKPEMKSLKDAEPAISSLRGAEPSAPEEIIPESFGPDAGLEQGSAYEREAAEAAASGVSPVQRDIRDVSGLSRTEIEAELNNLSRTLRANVMAQRAGVFPASESESGTAGRKLAET